MLVPAGAVYVNTSVTNLPRFAHSFYMK